MSKASDAKTTTRPLPAWRIGLSGGVVGILCCVGPTALALLGIIGTYDPESRTHSI
jgi:hypothetical protein